jgi:AcrR family transcriptional regulator
MRNGAEPIEPDGERSAAEGEQSAPLTGRGAQTRERLIVAAREVFEERGFIDTRVAHITRHARVSYGSFYTYFPSKEAVFLEIADRHFEDMTRNTVVPSPSAAAPAEGLSPAARIRRANGAYYRAYLRNAKMMAIIEQVATFNEEFQEMRRKHRAVSVGRSAEAIKRWQRAGLVAEDLDPEMTARALAAMVDHSLYLWLVQREDPPGTERLLDTLDTLSIRALGLPQNA